MICKDLEKDKKSGFPKLHEASRFLAFEKNFTVVFQKLYCCSSQNERSQDIRTELFKLLHELGKLEMRFLRKLTQKCNFYNFSSGTQSYPTLFPGGYLVAVLTYPPQITVRGSA